MMDLEKRLEELLKEHGQKVVEEPTFYPVLVKTYMTIDADAEGFVLDNRLNLTKVKKGLRQISKQYKKLAKVNKNCREKFELYNLMTFCALDLIETLDYQVKYWY